MRIILTTLAASLVMACSPELNYGDLDELSTSEKGTLIEKDPAEKVIISGGATLATDKDCDPDKDPNCYDINGKIVASGGGNDIHPDPTRDDIPPSFPWGPGGTSLTADTQMPGINLILAGSSDQLFEAVANRDSASLSAFVTGQPARTEIVGVTALDMNAGQTTRSGMALPAAPAMLIELSDGTTWLSQGEPSGEIAFTY